MGNEALSIDISVIRGLVGDDESIIKHFFNKFLDTVPELIQEIKADISTRNTIKIKFNAHKMKSSAKAIGALKLSDICQFIEDASSESNQPLLQQLQHELLQEFDNCRQYIDSY